MTQIPKAPEGHVADAVKGNWVDTSAPDWARPYLRLSRADRPIGTWLLYLPCVWSILLAAGSDSLGWWDAWLIMSMGAGAFLMRGAGCTWNDFTDRHIDAQVTRTRSRPIPSGQVTAKQALIWMCIQALIAFAILLTYGMPAIAVGIASLVFVCIYPFAKRFTWWPQAFLGLAFNWGALMGWVAHNGQLPLAAFLLYAAGISWTLFYDTIYAYQDTEDDALIGVRSTARLFGDAPHKWMLTFILLAMALLSLAVAITFHDLWAMAVCQVGIAGFGLHLWWQLSRMEIKNPGNLLQLFRSNRNAGLILVLFFAIADML